MKKRVSDKFWFPFWVDKWIFGSMRIECTIEERAIWIDLLALATKDDGHIRANEDIAYPIQQLSGMLMIPEKALKSAIEKFIKLDKLVRSKTGTLYIKTWERYQFSESYDRVKKHRKKKSNGKSLQRNQENNKEKNNITKNNKINKIREEQLEEEFSQFWNIYNYKVSKKDAYKAFKAIRRSGVSLDRILKCTKGYKGFLKSKRVHDNFEQEIKYPAGFLRNDYLFDYENIEYKPPL